MARRSRGTPRLANRLLKRVRDFAQVLSDGTIVKGLTWNLDNYTFDEYETCRENLPDERNTTYTVTGLTQATTYTFKIKVFDTSK